MDAVILNGSTKDDEFLDDVHQMIVGELVGIGWETQTFTLHEMDIHHCIGCFGCWIQTPGRCVIDDAGRDVARAFIQSDLVVYLTPVTFGGYSSQLKKALDRCICILSPFFKKIDGEIHHQPRYERYPRLIGLGALSAADAENERIFTTLIDRNAINLHNPAHAGGVILRDQDPDTIRARIRALLKAVEVGG